MDNTWEYLEGKNTAPGRMGSLSDLETWMWLDKWEPVGTLQCYFSLHREDMISSRLQPSSEHLSPLVPLLQDDPNLFCPIR